MSVYFQETLKDHPRLIWLDASQRFVSRGVFRAVRSRLVQTGGVMMMRATSHTIFAATHHQVYQYFPCDMNRIKHTGKSAGHPSIVRHPSIAGHPSIARHPSVAGHPSRAQCGAIVDRNKGLNCNMDSVDWNHDAHLTQWCQLFTNVLPVALWKHHYFCCLHR